MICHIAIHHPYPEETQRLIDSMHRFGQVAQTQPGLREVHTLRDERSGTLVGLAVWESFAALQAARPVLGGAMKDEPFTDWEPQPPEVFLLEEV